MAVGGNSVLRLLGCTRGIFDSRHLDASESAACNSGRGLRRFYFAAGCADVFWLEFTPLIILVAAFAALAPVLRR